MSTKTQFTLLFFVGLFAGIVVESHVLSPLTQLRGTSMGATVHSVGYASELASAAVDSQHAPTLADPLPNGQERSPEPVVAGIPKIGVDQPVFDFGDRNAGELVEHSFILTNRGEGTLLIDQVKTSCGCTVAQISSKNIPPGGTANLMLKLNLHLQKGSQNRVAIV